MNLCRVLMWSLVAQLPTTGPTDVAVPAIRLYNPTAWEMAVPVEIPTGRLAAPGLLDWTQVHLECAGVTVPHALRSGRATWQLASSGSRRTPRAEDLLVFSCAVPARQWARIEVKPGSITASPILRRESGKIILVAGDGRVVIDEPTATLDSWELSGAALLARPLRVTAVRLRDPAYALEGYLSVGYTTAAINVCQGDAAPLTVSLAEVNSAPALTELRFALDVAQGPSATLTYRLHHSGQLEITCDERPWEGNSPWLGHALQYSLDVAGQSCDTLAELENRWAFYGFRDYTAAVKSVARVHRQVTGGVLETGEEFVNGRHFARRLTPIASPDLAQVSDLAELLDEGFVTDIQPLTTGPLTAGVQVSDTTSSPAVVAELTQALSRAGVPCPPSASPDQMPITLTLRTVARPEGISGDGYVIQWENGSVAIDALTRLGLYSAVRTIAQHLQRTGREGDLPLVARNPVVDLRGGGFGGGNFEVDVPYGTETEWYRVFDNLLDSGMNVFACMGMWANWKMPVSYRHMSALRSDAPDAYDESSGAKFVELEHHREHGLRLARYLQDRGGQVWLWVPIGCVPTTFAARYPEAMSPASGKIPCFTHPKYQAYVNAFLQELVETYPLEGMFLVRDDNGGVCTCERCQAYVAASRTKNAVWEQYLVIYDWLRAHAFRGAIAVYPYHDWYYPALDPLLPQDLYVVGHGAGAAVLVRDYRFVGPMGDTWLDNLYANFRVPPSPRMRRLLGDRGSFWIGGAYVGCELPWEAIGYFGWEPTAAPNTLRYDWACRELGVEPALAFARMNDVYEELWDINALYMPPADWMKLHPSQREQVVQRGMDGVRQLTSLLKEVRPQTPSDQFQCWLGHMQLFAPFFTYHLQRLDRFARVHDAVLSHRDALDSDEGLPPAVRAAVLRDYQAIYDAAAPYAAAMQQAPEGMLSHCRWMTAPYKEWMAGYDQWLDGQLALKQFVGRMDLATDPLKSGQPFTLRVTLTNLGLCPWVAAAGHRLELLGDAARLGLPAAWEYRGDPLAPGDRRTAELSGTVPADPGTAHVVVKFLTPYRVPEPFIQAEIELTWE